MPARSLAAACLVAVLALSACGSKTKNVDAATYTCAKFQKSLATKGDETSGNFINELVKQAKLKQTGRTARSEVTLGIFFACRNKPGSTRPAQTAIATAKRIEAGKFRVPAPQKKKSGK